jgi:predicted CXXCH cytochrome family protein
MPPLFGMRTFLVLCCTGLLLMACTAEPAPVPAEGQGEAPANAQANAPTGATADPAQPTAKTGNPCFESGCHSELKAQEGPIKHQPYVDGQCLSCHKTYHTEETQKKYTQSDIDLCYSCHVDSQLGVTHPVGEGVIDPNTGQMMTCTSTCHLNHTAPYEYLLSNSGSGPLCVSCHKDFLQN